MPAERLNIFHDASGLVTVAVFRQRAGNQQQHFTDFAAEIPPDMVVVGGGGLGDEDPGNLLTASYPNDQLSAWLVSSKDHEVPDACFLEAYAIGLSIRGMTRDQLIGNVFVGTADSGTGAHPEATADVPEGFVLISGGFRVDWHGAGNLGTASFPSSNFSWTARSKDHDIPSPANIRAFAICLREHLPVGQVSVAITSQDSGAAPHPASIADVRPGFALTGGGAEVHWQGAGNLLWKLQPTTTTSRQDFAAASKDHIDPDPSTITAYALGIRILR
jgi:hypothetical protein